MIIFLLVLILIAILWPGLIRFTLAALLLIGLWSMPSHAATDDQFVHDLIKAEEWLNTTCRASNPEFDHRGKAACKARRALYEIIDENNWCYGKIGQIGADMRWHKCTKNSERPTQENFHSWD